MSGADGFAWRRIAVPAFGPTLLSAGAMGAVVPIAALRADELGASLGAAAFVVALMGVGQLVGVLPAGSLVARIGERGTLWRAGIVDVVALAVAGWAPWLWLMGVALFASGLASSAFFLARQGFMIDVLPPARLARGMSLLGGSMRTGLLLGPAVGSLAIAPMGLQGAYAVAVALALASLVVVLASPDLTREHERARAQEPHAGVFLVIRQHARLLLTQGIGVLVISALRNARLVILPLWAVHIGLDGVDSSQIFAVAGVAELLFVYPGGWAMDRLGRVWVVGALLSVISVSFLLLPLAEAKGTLLAVALLMAIGNGLGSGIVMTLGADAAPRVDRAQFLGAWRLMGEVGNAGGTLGVSAVTAVASLPVAAVVLGVAGLLGLGWTSGWVLRADRERSSTSSAPS
ncbi:MAG TPA: MFS transporter [Candidatus Janibacter merdipullorum]|nr:MFS transporter [Candidatus Janibacter merdipullorum]